MLLPVYYLAIGIPGAVTLLTVIDVCHETWSISFLDLNLSNHVGSGHRGSVSYAQLRCSISNLKHSHNHVVALASVHLLLLALAGVHSLAPFASTG